MRGLDKLISLSVELIQIRFTIISRDAIPDVNFSSSRNKVHSLQKFASVNSCELLSQN